MKPVTVYYDGACGMCRGAADVARRHGRPGMLEVVDGTTPDGQHRLERLGKQERFLETMIVEFPDGTVAEESRAVIAVAHRLRGWRRLGVGMWVLPRPVRDACYRRVARNRQRACHITDRHH